jgi:hypothetical protein
VAGDPLEVTDDLINPDHRLPGERESESSQLLEDAQHWLRVYTELVAFKHTLLRTAEIHKEDAPEAVAAEVSNDQAILRLELERLTRRHDFWSDRVSRLQTR